MDNNVAFAEALIPGRHTVAGIALQPLAIGHALLLQKRASPLCGYWSENAPSELELGDMALVIWVCSRSATRAMRTMGGLWMRWQLKRIARRILRVGVFQTHMDIMRYIAGSFNSPRMKLGEGSKQMGAPMLGCLQVAMMGHFGCNLAEALNTPISLAMWLRSILLDEKGFAQIWTKGDYDTHEQMQEMVEQLARNPDELEKLFPPRNGEGTPDGQGH